MVIESNETSTTYCFNKKSRCKYINVCVVNVLFFTSLAFSFHSGSKKDEFESRNAMSFLFLKTARKQQILLGKEIDKNISQLATTFFPPKTKTERGHDGGTQRCDLLSNNKKQTN